MGIMGIHAIPMMITCMLQGTLCDTGIPCTFYVHSVLDVLPWYLMYRKEGNPQLTDHDQNVSRVAFLECNTGQATKEMQFFRTCGTNHAIQRRQLSLLMSQCGLLGKTTRGRATTSGYVRGDCYLFVCNWGDIKLCHGGLQLREQISYKYYNFIWSG